MTVRTRAELNSDADTLLPDNTAGEISPEDVRGRIKDLADSVALNRNALLRACGIAKALLGYQRDIDTIACGFAASGDADASSTDGAVDTADGAWKPGDAVTAQIDQSLSADNNGPIGKTARQILPASAFTALDGDKIRLTLKSATTLTGFTITKMYIGERASSGDAYDFAGSPTQITFDGGAASTGAVATGATKVSDWIDFAFDHTKTYVVSWYTTSGSCAYFGSLPGFACYLKSGDDATTVDATGYSADTVDLNCVAKLESSVPANSSLIIPYQTADAARTKVRGIFEVDPVDAFTSGSDWTVEFTCDAGANWTAASTYTNCGTAQDGRTVIETDEVTCTSGTSFSARVKNLNNKQVDIYKAALEAAA